MNIWAGVWTVGSEYRTVGTVYLHRCMDSRMSALDNQMALWKVRLMNEVAYEVRYLYGQSDGRMRRSAGVRCRFVDCQVGVWLIGFV